MNNQNGETRTLSKNNIKNFILRIDLIKKPTIEIKKIAEEMSKHFDQTEQRHVNNFTINVTEGKSQVSENKYFDYVSTSESKAISMTFSEFNNAIWLQSNRYRNNGIYKDIIKQVIEVIKSHDQEAEAKRIGMRFFNEFSCKNISGINHIFGKRLNKIVKAMLKEKQQIRAISMEEYNNDGYKLRMQYGIPNKFYPSLITVYDLLLDIDSYIESTCNIDEWEENILEINHAAYNCFIKEMNPDFLKELK